MPHEFIAKTFCGPQLRSIQRRRAAFDYPKGLGWAPQLVQTIANLLQAWGLEGAPCIIAEDGAALQVATLHATFSSLHSDTWPVLAGSLGARHLLMGSQDIACSENLEHEQAQAIIRHCQLIKV